MYYCVSLASLSPVPSVPRTILHYLLLTLLIYPQQKEAMPISTRKRVLDLDISHETTEKFLEDRPVKASRKSTCSGDIRSFIGLSSPLISSSGQTKTKLNPESKPSRFNSKACSGQSNKPSKNNTKDVYKSTLADVDKTIKHLDCVVKAQGPNKKCGINGDDYAKSMARFAPEVTSLLAIDTTDSVTAAFNLMLYLGQHLHGDFGISRAASGYGDNDTAYKELDELMLRIIKRRSTLQLVERSEPLPPLPKRETEIDVGVFKTGRPNKQQRGRIAKAREKWAKERTDQMRKRREKVEDWVGNALLELVDERNYIALFGLKGYFPESIANLEKLKGYQDASAAEIKDEPSFKAI